MKQLNLKVGDKVRYQPSYYGKQRWENGIVKEIPEYYEGGSVRVVYHCNGEWDRYMDYTSALTRIEDLKIGWK